jgi:phage gp37-like protein
VTTYAQIRDGIKACLVGKIAPAQGQSMDATMYVRRVDDYFGQLEDPTMLEEVASLTPAVLVAFAGEKPLPRTTIGRRMIQVQSSFAAICIVDMPTHRQTKGAQLEQLVGDVQRLVASRKFDAGMEGLEFGGVTIYETLDRNADFLIAYAVVFSCVRHVDVTKPIPGAPIKRFDGHHALVRPGLPAVPPKPALVVSGGANGRVYAYQVVAEYADGSVSNPSFPGWTINGPDTLGAQTITVSWAAQANAVRYHVYRRTTEATSGNAATRGKVATVNAPATQLVDNGLVGDGVVPSYRGVNLTKVLP